VRSLEGFLGSYQESRHGVGGEMTEIEEGNGKGHGKGVCFQDISVAFEG
jgi:hypothetical protein